MTTSTVITKKKGDPQHYVQGKVWKIAQTQSRVLDVFNLFKHGMLMQSSRTYTVYASLYLFSFWGGLERPREAKLHVLCRKRLYFFTESANMSSKNNKSGCNKAADTFLFLQTLQNKDLYAFIFYEQLHYERMQAGRHGKRRHIS